MKRTRKPRIPSAEMPLETYLNSINETPLLNAAEEKELAYRIQNGDPQARDHMVRANLRLVVNIARGYSNRGLALQDLIAEGNLGLMRAVEAFDPSLDTRFSTYATYWIKQSIKRCVTNTGKTIRVPAYMAQLLSDWRRASARLQDELGRPPTEEELAKVLDLSKKRLAIIRKALRIYNATPQTEDGEGVSFEESLLDNQTRAPDSMLMHKDDMRHVLGLLDKMDPREATVLRLRFGLGGDEPKSLKEIGDVLNLTRERVRQIEHEGLRKLNVMMSPNE